MTVVWAVLTVSLCGRAVLWVALVAAARRRDLAVPRAVTRRAASAVLVAVALALSWASTSLALVVAVLALVIGLGAPSRRSAAADG